MGIGDRIREVRKSLGLTQQRFGERIDLKSNSIALIEGGRNTSDQTISAICREFNVDRKWLETGEGEMFAKAPASELDALAAKYPNMTRETYVLVEQLINLSKSEQDVIAKFIKKVADSFTADFEEPPAPAKSSKEMSIEELHAELDRQHSLEEKAAGEPSASGRGNSGMAAG